MKNFKSLYYVIIAITLVLVPAFFKEWYYSIISLIVGALSIGFIAGIIRGISSRIGYNMNNYPLTYYVGFIYLSILIWYFINKS